MERRYLQLKAEVARRLAPVLCDVPTALFEELVDLVASLQYEREPKRQHDDAEDGSARTGPLSS